jgi:hypothetical protein
MQSSHKRPFMRQIKGVQSASFAALSLVAARWEAEGEAR